MTAAPPETTPASPDAEPGPRGGLDRRRPVVLAALLLLLAHAALAWLGRAETVGTDYDSSRYVLLAQSIREGSYREIWRADAPLHGRFPPLYPAALAVWGAAFGDDPSTLALLGVLLSTATLALAFDAVRRLWSPSLGLACLLPAALNPWLVGRAGTVFSEPLYAFLSVAALWALVRNGDRPRRLVVAGAAAFAAALTRSVGVTLVFVLLLHWLLERRFAAAAILAVIAALLLGGWHLAPVIAPPGAFGETYAADVPVPAAPVQADGPGPLSEAATRTTGNVRRYASLSLAFLGLPEPHVAFRFAAALAAIVVLAGVFVIARRWRPAGLYLVTYGVLLVGWTWPVPRLLEPLLPLLVPGTVLAVAAGARRWRARWGLRAAWLAAAGIAASAGITSARLVSERRACEGAYLAYPHMTCASSALDARILRAIGALKRLAPEDAVVLTEQDAPVYLHTGRRTVHFARVAAASPSEFVPLLRRSGIDYVLHRPTGGRWRRPVGELLRTNCEAFELFGRAGDVLLLRLPEREAGEGEGDACAALVAEGAATAAVAPDAAGFPAHRPQTGVAPAPHRGHAVADDDTFVPRNSRQYMEVRVHRKKPARWTGTCNPEGVRPTAEERGRCRRYLAEAAPSPRVGGTSTASGRRTGWSSWARGRRG